MNIIDRLLSNMSLTKAEPNKTLNMQMRAKADVAHIDIKIFEV